jgi:hypothetical protein
MEHNRDKRSPLVEIIMSRRLSTAISIATLVLVMVMLSVTARALQSRAGTSAGVGCAYLNGSGFSTLVVSVESTGPEEPLVARGMTCAAAFKALMGGGFDLVDEGPAVARDFDQDGVVDAADYVVWRKTFGRTPESRSGTIVITACTHFNLAEPRTELTGVDYDGATQPPLITGLSCAAAVNALIDRGFVRLHNGPTVVGDFNSDGVADSQDYGVWQTNFGRTQ